MISHKAKVGDHCPKAVPSRERRGFDDEAGETAGCLDVRVHRLREFHKVVLLERRLWLHVQDGMLFIEVVFEYRSFTIAAVRGPNSPTVLMRRETAIPVTPSTLRWLAIDRQGTWTPARKPQCPSVAAKGTRGPAADVPGAMIRT